MKNIFSRTAFGACLAAMSAVSQAGTYVYVSNAEDGDISAYTLDSLSGALVPGASVPAAKMAMPMAVFAPQRVLYAAARSKPYRLFSYRIDAASGQLTPLEQTPLPESMVSISVDPVSRLLYGAAYGANSVYVATLGEDGKAVTMTHYFPSGSVKPHTVKFDNSGQFAYVPHLGSDEILQYRVVQKIGALVPNTPPSVRLTAGSGPRHLVISPDDRFAYQLSQLTGTVSVLARQVDGTLQVMQEVSALPPGSKLVVGKPRPAGMNSNDPDVIWSADIHLTPDGRYLYTSERTTSTLSAFAVDRASGGLRFLGSFPTATQPRAFAIAPEGRFLVVSGERSNELFVHRIEDDGKLAVVGKAPSGRGANWVEIVRIP